MELLLPTLKDEFWLKINKEAKNRCLNHHYLSDSKLAWSVDQQAANNSSNYCISLFKATIYSLLLKKYHLEEWGLFLSCDYYLLAHILWQPSGITLWNSFSTWWISSIALQQYLNYHVTPTKDHLYSERFGIMKRFGIILKVVKCSSLPSHCHFFPLHTDNTGSHVHFQKQKAKKQRSESFLILFYHSFKGENKWPTSWGMWSETKSNNCSLLPKAVTCLSWNQHKSFKC